MKRLFDFCVASVTLLVFAPMLLVIAVLVRLFLGSPVLFRQQRPGYQEKIFTLLKFRTMRDAIGSDGKMLPDSERLTRFGKMLRKTSLDELPSLWNIVKGDMSLVGPRPLLVRYLDRYTTQQNRRHEVRPGLTGWAQVNGRNNLSWEEKFLLDVEYVDTRSFWFDLRIILMTFKKILVAEGVSSQEHVTCEEFLGNPNDFVNGC